MLRHLTQELGKTKQEKNLSKIILKIQVKEFKMQAGGLQLYYENNSFSINFIRFCLF